MMDWKSWGPSDRTKNDEIQKDQYLVGRMLLPFAADDDHERNYLLCYLI